MSSSTKPKKKNPAAVMLGRLGGLKGGPARAAKLTPEQLSESARKAVQARWTKAKAVKKTRMETTPATGSTDTSDNAVLALLKRIKASNNAKEVRQFADQLERVIFHKQYENA